MSIPFIRAAQRSCGHCKKNGHNQTNCPKATIDATHMHREIQNIRGRDAAVVEDGLRFYFNLKTVHELSILMKYVARRMTPLIKLMVERGKITVAESSMRRKDDRIKVLMWYFWYTTVKYKEYKHGPNHKKLDILAKSFESVTDLTEFECPICVDCKPAKERTVTNCNHSVCKSCIDIFCNHQLTTVNFPQPRCPLCRTSITSLTFANTDYIQEVSNKYFNIPVTV